MKAGMLYINGIGMISPQRTTDPAEFLPEVTECETDFLHCIEPVYRNFIDPIQSRRMSRLIKMGIASAKISLADAGVGMPGAIITGTGLGSVDDTEKILGEITRDEKFLNPTPFIQSTYNTISSQVAIQLKCHHYNSTYVHRTFSFESVLTDALMQAEEGMADTILAGAIDEMTENHLRITRRIGLWKKTPVNNLKVRETGTPGAMAGEGAAFFTLSTERSASTYCRLADVAMGFNGTGNLDMPAFLDGFLHRNGLSASDIDLLLTGISGDSEQDPLYFRVAAQFFPGKPLGWFKHLCGEYHTATGFGLYAAANMLKHQRIPEVFIAENDLPDHLSNILLYNHHAGVNHSLILVRKA